MDEVKNCNIFISPIDWGLGHAARCVPVVRQLSENNNIVLGVTASNHGFFDYYFPGIEKIVVPSYNIRYSAFWPAYLKVLFQWPGVMMCIRRERKQLKNLILEKKIQVIISDNRYGFFDTKLKSILITHQLNLKVPFFSPFVNYINRAYLKRFHEIWVPDFEDPKLRLSGELSDSSRLQSHVKFIEPKSALYDTANSSEKEKTSGILVLLSGVEPQRSILETNLVNALKGQTETITFIRGTQLPLRSSDSNIIFHNELFGEKLKQLILMAETIICRSGYSTLMDMACLRKHNLILVPTPGQPEQEYLAEYWQKKFNARVYKQNELGRLKP